MVIVIIGLGSIALKHINSINKIDSNAQIFALKSSSEQAKEIDGVKNIFSFSELKLLNPDFIIISNPTVLHLETIKECMHLHVPLFIEKPAIHELFEIDEVLTYINHNNIRTYVACNLRFLECIKFAQNYMKGRFSSLNEVNVYCGSYLPNWRPSVDYRKSYSANVDLGGGVHLDLIHELDYVYWLFGRPEQVRSIKRKLSSLEINSFDYSNYLLEYNSFIVTVTLNYFRVTPKRELEMVFDDHVVNIDLLSNSVYINGKLEFKFDQTISDTYDEQMQFFVSNKNVHFNTLKESVEVLKICLDE
ncbi:Inositol 2-dehydrogenase/D-chiro-inositol 3-dehydrogenase [compost metagenome]